MLRHTVYALGIGIFFWCLRCVLSKDERALCVLFCQIETCVSQTLNYKSLSTSHNVQTILSVMETSCCVGCECVLCIIL